MTFAKTLSLQFVLRVVGCLALGLTAALVAAGQTPGTKTAPVQPSASENPQEMRDRTQNITMLERGKDTAISREAALKQANEDFARIQVAEAELRGAFTSAAPDYKRISENATEIKTRAARLKDYLVLPPTAKDQKAKRPGDGQNAEQLETCVAQLKERVRSFATNPIFSKDNQQVDYREVARARRDLDDIIDVTARIRKDAEKAGSASGKTN